MLNNFKELGQFGKFFQVIAYNRFYSCTKMPAKINPEVILLGKSNVGKSSLINTLLNYNISKISRTPGCTRWIGMLELQNLTLIDLPGYGFAQVAKGRKKFWQNMIEQYSSTNRPNLALILVDSRKGIQKDDIAVSEIFNCPHIFLYTKCDLNSEFSKKTAAEIIPENAIPVCVKNGLGILELRKFLADF